MRCTGKHYKSVSLAYHILHVSSWQTLRSSLGKLLEKHSFILWRVQAYDVLADPVQRQQYDADLERTEAEAAFSERMDDDIFADLQDLMEDMMFVRGEVRQNPYVPASDCSW
jgi:hypothetical protein